MMSQAHIALLPARGVVAVSGAEARQFLDNLITNDLELLETQAAMHAALLTPQGKILFEFIVVKRPDEFLLETDRATVSDLLKRLTLYRLRAKVTLNDLSSSRTVVAAWGGPPPDIALAVTFRDPRCSDLGYRMIMAPEMAEKLAPENEGPGAYDRVRIAAGVAEGGRDYALGDAFPHEANFDRLGGVSFTKGCFVGQEVVARMQHKTVVRKRIVRVTSEAPLSEGADVKVGEAVIGRIGSVDGRNGLAMLRLDRALEARTKGQPLMSGSATITADAAALEAFQSASSAHAAPHA